MTRHDQFRTTGLRTIPAYTLIELLVVAALIGVLAGTVGLALRSPDDGMALQVAQATLASLCSAARGRAALTGRDARLLIAADPADLECHLRYLQIVHEDPAGSDHWRAEGSGVYLPRTSLPHALHAHLFLLAQSGGTLVWHHHPARDSPWFVHQCPR